MILAYNCALLESFFVFCYVVGHCEETLSITFISAPVLGKRTGVEGRLGCQVEKGTCTSSWCGFKHSTGLRYKRAFELAMRVLWSKLAQVF